MFEKPWVPMYNTGKYYDMLAEINITIKQFAVFLFKTLIYLPHFLNAGVYKENHHETLVWKKRTHELHSIGLHSGWVRGMNPVVCIPQNVTNGFFPVRPESNVVLYLSCTICITYKIKQFKKFTWAKLEQRIKEWSRNYFLFWLGSLQNQETRFSSQVKSIS